MTDNANLVH